MNLSAREQRLALITLAVILLGLGYVLGESRYGAWREHRQERVVLQRRQAAAEQLLERGGDPERRLAQLRETLPVYPRGTDVTAQLLRRLQQVADEHDFLLLRREPEPERAIGDLFELAISCTWEGELSALVHFLYALQAQGAIVDVRQLTVAPVQGSPERLRGTVTVDFAYSREGES